MNDWYLVGDVRETYRSKATEVRLPIVDVHSGKQQAGSSFQLPEHCLLEQRQSYLAGGPPR
jgi:hypothetical protein